MTYLQLKNLTHIALKCINLLRLPHGTLLADQTYGVNGSSTSEDQYSYTYDGTTHIHIAVLENWNPNLSSDPFNWIPKGLMEDMIDITPNESIVNDQVSGFTISELFAALQNDVTTVQQYHTRLITQNPTLPNNTTVAQLTALFTSYNY